MKMDHFIPCTKTITSKGTTKLFLDHVFQYHGLFEDKFMIVDFNLHLSSGNDS